MRGACPLLLWAFPVLGFRVLFTSAVACGGTGLPVSSLGLSGRDPDLYFYYYILLLLLPLAKRWHRPGSSWIRAAPGPPATLSGILGPVPGGFQCSVLPEVNYLLITV